jgi:hypothetical protein
MKCNFILFFLTQNFDGFDGFVKEKDPEQNRVARAFGMRAEAHKLCLQLLQRERSRWRFAAEGNETDSKFEEKQARG